MLTTFNHKHPNWTLIGQSPAESHVDWLWENVADYKIIHIYKSRSSHSCKETGLDSFRLVSNEVSELRRKTAFSSRNVSCKCTQEKFAAIRMYFKLCKVPGPNLTRPELMVHAKTSLTSWFANSFFPACVTS